MSESELVRLPYPGAPEILTGIPGPKSLKVLKNVARYESLTCPGGAAPPVFDEGMGATIKDPDGNLFIDLAAGVAVSAVGRRHPKVIKAIEKQLDKIMHAAEAVNARRTELAGKIFSIMPGGLRDNCVSYFTQSGSGAVDTAIKFARHLTGRAQIVAFHRAYHGVWCGSGVIAVSCGRYHNVIRFMPPLTITREYLENTVEIVLDVCKKQ